MINLYQLQIFLAVVEQGSFSAAAIRLNMSQPAVSQQVRAVEDYYKVKLFARYGQKIELTEAAHALLGPARQLLAEAVRLEERFSAGAGELQGRITLAYSRTAPGALYCLPEVLARFHQKYPAVQFFLQANLEDEAIARVLEYEVAFASLSYIPRHKTLENFLLKRDQLNLVLPPGHNWQNSKVSLSQLKGQRVVMRRAGSETRRRVEVALRAAGLSLNDLQLVAEIDSSEGIALAVEAGLGLGFLSDTIARHFRSLEWAEISLSAKEIAAGADLNREIYLVRHRPNPTHSPSPAQQRFWEDLLASDSTGGVGQV